MTGLEPSPTTHQLSIDQALQKAIACHQAGNLSEAEQLYRAILEIDPKHPDANHNLGVLAVQVNQAAAGLPYFKAALEANLNYCQYWTSYIDALVRAEQHDVARQTISIALQRGIDRELIQPFEQRLGLSQENSFSEVSPFEAAIAHREAGRYLEAIQHLQAYLVERPADATAYALLGHTLLLDKQEEAAGTAIGQARAIAPSAPVVQLNYARLLLKQQKNEAALLAAQAAHQSMPQNPESCLVLAAALGANNRNDMALPLVDRVLQDYPDYAEAYATRALFKLRNKDSGGALGDAEKALSIKPHLAQLWSMTATLRHQFKNLAGTIEALQKALKYDPDNVGYMVNLGEFLRQNQQPDDAIVWLQKAVATAPDNFGGWVNLGTALQAVGRNDEARAAYTKALKINPLSAEITSNLGLLAKDEADWEEALRYFDMALRIKPDHVPTLVDQAIIFSTLKRYEEAAQMAQRAVTIDATHKESRFALYEALIGQKCYDEALVVLNGIAQLPETDAASTYCLSNAYARLYSFTKLWPEAEHWARKTLELRPDLAEAHSNLGCILKGLGQLEEAKSCFCAALEIEPRLAMAHYNLGNTLKALGRLDEAEQSFRHTLEIMPDYVEAHINLANVLKELGRHSEAEASCRAALKITPDLPGVYNNLGAILCELDRQAEAEECYLETIRITAGEASELLENACRNYGSLLDARGLHREAVSYYQQAFMARSGWLPDVDKELTPGLLYAHIELTNECNFHCDFCPSDSQQRERCFMNMELIQQICNELSEKSLAGRVNLHLMGEPTLHPQLLEVLNYAASKNILTDLVTNGSTLNTSTVHSILNALHGTLIISLQTPTNETFKHRGTVGLDWERYIGNIRLLVREYLRRVSLKQACHNTLDVRVMVTKGSKLSAKIIESFDEIRSVMAKWYDFVAALETEFGLSPFNRKELSADIFTVLATQSDIKYPLQRGVTLTFWQGFTFANTMLSNEYLLEAKETASYCKRPFLDIAILADGQATLCCLDYDGKLAVGNVKENSIEDLLKGQAAKNLRSAMLGHYPLPYFCQQCQAKTKFITSDDVR